MGSRGKAHALMQAPLGALTLIILLDQFSRNIFRGQAEAFAHDPKAFEVAHYASARPKEHPRRAGVPKTSVLLIVQ